MKHLRITVRPDPARAPPFLSHLLDSAAVTEARAVDWNRAAAETTTHLYALDGDVAGFADAARETPGVESVRVRRGDGPVGYALLEVRDADVPMFGVIEGALARAGLVVRRPLVYRDGRIHGHVVGDPGALQAVLDETSDAVDVRVDEIGTFPSGRESPADGLSERQREAVEAALDLGYYETPREATHEDVAEELGCAPNTATAHLQRAEARLVRAGMEKFWFDG